MKRSYILYRSDKINQIKTKIPEVIGLKFVNKTHGVCVWMGVELTSYGQRVL